MNTEAQTRLAEARAMLEESQRLNDSGQHGAAMKEAYLASEYVADAYLAAVTGQSLPPNDASFEQFSETIQEPERHPDLLSKIEDVIGDVYILREAYEPALLDETTDKDARQMIGHVVRLLEFTSEIISAALPTQVSVT